jgi:hypothetical protein
MVVIRTTRYSPFGHIDVISLTNLRDLLPYFLALIAAGNFQFWLLAAIL